MLKRGYAVDVIPETNANINEIVYLGNYSKSEYNATPIISKSGITPTVRENHGQIMAIIEDISN